jgi:hypothetical protein
MCRRSWGSRRAAAGCRTRRGSCGAASMGAEEMRLQCHDGAVRGGHRCHGRQIEAIHQARSVIDRTGQGARTRPGLRQGRHGELLRTHPGQTLRRAQHDVRSVLGSRHELDTHRTLLARPATTGRRGGLQALAAGLPAHVGVLDVELTPGQGGRGGREVARRGPAATADQRGPRIDQAHGVPGEVLRRHLVLQALGTDTAREPGVGLCAEREGRVRRELSDDPQGACGPRVQLMPRTVSGVPGSAAVTVERRAALAPVTSAGTGVDAAMELSRAALAETARSTWVDRHAGREPGQSAQ